MKIQFPVEEEYQCCIYRLELSGILMSLPESTIFGVIGADGKAYPVPNLEQVMMLFDWNRELVERKSWQGFNQLQLTPMAMPLFRLVKLLKTAILRHAAEGKIYLTRHSESDLSYLFA